MEHTKNMVLYVVATIYIGALAIDGFSDRNTANETTNESQIVSFEAATPPQSHAKKETSIVEKDLKNMNLKTLVRTIVYDMSQKYDLQPSLVMGVIEVESNFQQELLHANTNGTVDKGLMQLNESTYPWLAKKVGLNYKKGMELNIHSNIEMGIYYLSYLQNLNSNPHFVLTAYNRGPGGAQKWYEWYGTYETTYSRVVMKKIQKYATQMAAHESTKLFAVR